MSKKLSFLVSFVLLVGVVNGVVLGYPDQNDYSIPRSMPPTIDGVISPGEWEKTEWIAMTEVVPVGTYPDPPPDLSDCWWAAMWNPKTNLLYVAAYGTDTDHIFKEAFVGWDKQDHIEIYVDAANKDIKFYNPVDGQDYFMGPTTTGGGWVNLADTPADYVVPGGYRLFMRKAGGTGRG